MTRLGIYELFASTPLTLRQFPDKTVSYQGEYIFLLSLNASHADVNVLTVNVPDLGKFFFGAVRCCLSIDLVIPIGWYVLCHVM